MPARRSTGTSGVAVGLAAVGGVLVYSALRGATPLEALRDVLSGNVSPVPDKSSASAIPSVPGGYGAGPNAWLAQTALTQIGVPYKWGGNSPSGFDCSGLVQWSFKINGISAPRTSWAQFVWSKLVKISKSDVAAGDLVFWPGHVVIAISNTDCVAAQHTGTLVQTLPIAKAHAGPVQGYRRYIGGK